METDVCIVGAGIAGIALTREFIGRQFRVCLVECGGLGPDRRTQSLLSGENVGHPYYPLDVARSSGFGGSSNRWTIGFDDARIGVRLRPLDSIDFEQREWIPYSGWPFAKSHLDPYYERAQAVCRIGPYAYHAEDWEHAPDALKFPFVNERVTTAMFQFAARDLFAREYRQDIIAADNITTCTDAHVVEIETGPTAENVNRLRLATLNGRTFWIRAKKVVLAAGAIETPRLLLLSRSVQKNGLGNDNDLVGRFFMEHPHLWSGKFIPSDRVKVPMTTLYRMHTVGDVPIMGKFTLSEEVLRKERLLNYCVSIHPYPAYHRHNVIPRHEFTSWPLLRFTQPAAEARPESPARILYRNMRNAGSAVKRSLMKTGEAVIFLLNHMTEQAPNPDSRVMLSEDRDALGRNRIRLDWRMIPLDIRSIVRSQEVIDEELSRAGLGRLEIELHGDTPPSHLQGGWHHMGTTRMHDDPKQGVVDANCRIHGIENLFIAGPSVFPTGGYANPVLTIVALAVRLGDHVKRIMAT